jgi:hypothetical protein
MMNIAQNLEIQEMEFKYEKFVLSRSKVLI